MLLDYLNGNLSAIMLKLIAISIMWALVLIAVCIDLFFGIRKSKEVGEFKTHSFGLRQTVKKVIYYMAFMTFMLMADGLNPLGYYVEFLNIVPITSVFGALVLVYTEFISVKEKAEEKYVKRTASVANDLIKLAVENVEVMDKLKEQIHKKE